MNPLDLIPAPYRLIATGLILVALVTGLIGYGYRWGHKNAENACTAEKLTAVQKAVQEAQATAQHDAEIAAANIQTVERVRTITRTIRAKESSHAQANPLPANCVLDDVRMWHISSALSGSTTTDPAKPDSTMPGVTGAAIK